ncbi:MAG: pectin acetylesterase-family hydrolase [Pseudomonadota bacterium]|nr:pectin acetylesterase-family hydrolase [Pseudomonadota bacterium]
MAFETRTTLFTVLVLLTSACSTQNSGLNSAPTEASTTQVPATTNGSVAEWQEILPGRPAVCSDGSDYKFLTRAGNAKKLLVYMQGGGACWFRKNCDAQMQPTYTINVDQLKGYQTGIFNLDNPANPFADYTVVFAPYCSGDVHIGSSDTVYPGLTPEQQPLTIHHQGRANMQAVLDWTYANVSKPKQIFVTGSSAGAIPSPFYAALIADHYTQATVTQLGDGAGGYRRMNNDTRPHESWGTFNFITNEAGFGDLQSDTMTYESLYIAAAKQHPNVQFAAYDAAQDSVQKRFLALSGQTDVDLLEAISANQADIRAEVSNFKSFITGGASHTVLARPQFYTYAANGVSVRDWVTALANNQPIYDVRCVKCDQDGYLGAPLSGPLKILWQSWEDPKQQYVQPFQIFDNVYYVGIDWVAAYLIDTGDGLVLIDSLYGKWINVLERNIRQLGFDPADIKYLINTHGHFDHAGGSAHFQKNYGTKVVMTEQDWQIAMAEPDSPLFYIPTPRRDIVAKDGDEISLGDNTFTLYNTPGHTTGVLSVRYQVHDGDDRHTALTLGGVGLNFSGVARTETYIDSYQRLQSMQDDIQVSLPNHQSMGRVFQRRDALPHRANGDPHPFVDAAGYQADLATFVANAQRKLEQEQRGTAADPTQALRKALAAPPQARVTN